MLKQIQAIRVMAIALLLFCSMALKAQVVTTASITGTVTDPTGAVLPGVSIVATNISTNVQTPTTTDSAGEYNIRFLEIGTYKVEFKMQGFGTQDTQPFVLEVAQVANIGAKLSPAADSTQVTVQAELAPLLNTENAVQSTVLDSRAIANIPLFGRSLTDLTQYQPGAVSTSPTGVGNNISVNGSRNQGNNYSLNGMETNQNIDYGQTYQPNPDAVEQVQMISATPSAEYGNVEGGTFLTVLKSGTNQFHGNAFINLRNYLLNANTYGNKHTSGTPTPRSVFTTYQMGGTLGGPIIRNKLFGFGDYQGYRTHSSSHGYGTVATYDERGCSGGQPGSPCTGGTTADFSELLSPNNMCEASSKTASCTPGAGGKLLIQLFNPAGNAPGYTGNGFTPYANNQGIPIKNPVAKYLFAHNNVLPLPGSQLGLNGVLVSATGDPLDANGIGNGALSSAPGASNIATYSKSFNHSDQYDVKLDFKLSSKDSMSGSYSHYNTLGYTTPSIPINVATSTPNPINIGVLDEIHTFNAALVNDFRAGFQRYVSLGAATIDTSGVFGTQGDSILGIGGVTNQPYQGYASQSSSIPGTLSGSLVTSRGLGESWGGTNNTGTNIVENTFIYADTLTWLKNKHTFKLGMNISRYQQNNFYPGNDGSLGAMLVTGAFTANPFPTTGAGCCDPRAPVTYAAQGYDVRGYATADLESDQISGTDIGGVSGFVGMRQYRDAYFINDDWKIRPNLTLNLGFRYEYNTQISEVNNKYDAPDIATQSLILAGTSAAETYCPGCSRTLVKPFYGGAEPRVGFAWSLTPRFVVRSGYSAANYMEGTGANLRMTTNPPFQVALESVAALPTTSSVGSAFTEEQGFNHTAVGGAPSGQVFLLWAKNIRPAWVNTYSLGVEYQLNNTSSVQLSYVGKQGQHLVTPGSANQLPQPCKEAAYITATNPSGVYTGASSAITASSACWTDDPAPYEKVPGVGYNGQVKLTNSNGYENDNSLQAVFRQRLWHGLQYTFNFTWSHAFTNDTGYYNGAAYVQNFYNFHADYAPTVEDIRLSSNWNMVYSLPVGRGRQYGAHMNRAIDEVVGGWIVSMTGVEDTGLPVNVSGAAAHNYMNGSGTERPNQYRPLLQTTGAHTMTTWYGTDPSTVSANVCSGDGVDNGICAFGQPALGTFGNAQYNKLRGPGNQLYNADVNKDFTIWHEHAVNFRADALNVFNQSELSSPGANPFGGTFGLITGVKSTQRQLQLTVSYHF